MTIAGYHMGGDLDMCVEETDRVIFLEKVKKLAIQRSVHERTIMIWCYLRSKNKNMAERIRSWITAEDATQRWLMELPTPKE